MQATLTVLFCVIGAMSCSGTIYLKDYFVGRPYELAYDRSFTNAIAEGASEEQAHRRALMAGTIFSKQELARRKREEQKDNNLGGLGPCDSSNDTINVKWD